MNHTKKRLTLMQRRAYAGYFFIFPLIIGVVLVFIPNLIQTFRFSINDIFITGNGYTLTYKGLDYYKNALFVDPKFVPILISTIKDLAVNVPVILIFSLFIASLLNQKFHGRVIARIIFFIPVILATGVITSMESDVMNYLDVGRILNTGASTNTSDFFQISHMLTSINFSPLLINIIVSLISGIYQIVKASGMQIFIFLAGLQEIPNSLYEAAEVEGCSKWELFWKITFPMISPQIAVNVVYTIADAYSRQDSIFSYIRDIAFNQNQYALATSMYGIYLLCLAALISIVFMVMAKFIRNRGE